MGDQILVKTFDEKRLNVLINQDKELKQYVKSLKEHCERWRKMFYEMKSIREKELKEFIKYKNGVN